MLLVQTSFCYSGASRMITTWHHKLIIINSSTYSNIDDDYNSYSECCTSYKIDECAMNPTCSQIETITRTRHHAPIVMQSPQHIHVIFLFSSIVDIISIILFVLTFHLHSHTFHVTHNRGTSLRVDAVAISR
jgi:hypothetical protein